MRIIVLITVILLSGMITKAQDVFFPTKVGTVLEYKTFDKKDQETGTIRYTITEIKSVGKDMDIIYLIETMDAKDKPVFKNEMTIHKKGDKLYVDMRKFIDSAILQKGGKVPEKLKITGNDMEIPSNLKVGDGLPDSEFEMAFKMGFINIKMGAKVTERFVELIENIDTKAGRFKAYKVTNKVMSHAMGKKTNTTSAEWLVKGIGMVRSEKYDKKGNLESSIQLVSLRE